MITEGEESCVAATLAEVSRHLGLSATTVSHALSGKRHVAPATVERVRAAAAELGYRVDAVAPRRGGARVIGLCVADLTSLAAALAADGVAAPAAENGCTLVLLRTGGSAEAELSAFGQLRAGFLDGLVLVGPQPSTATTLQGLAADVFVVSVRVDDDDDGAAAAVGRAAGEQLLGRLATLGDPRHA